MFKKQMKAGLNSKEEKLDLVFDGNTSELER